MSLTFIEINSRNLQHNLRQFKNIAPATELWPVIKSNAYGHGSSVVLGLLEEDSLVAGFACVNLDEALELAVQTTKPIMVLSYFDEEQKIEQAIKQQIVLPIYNLESADILLRLAQRLQQSASVMIKIDTGTNRLGFKPEDEELIAKLTQEPFLKIHSFYTHFAESELEDLDFSYQQLEHLKFFKNKYPNIRLHSACSAAAIALPEARQDIIRLGLALYGLWPSAASKARGQQQGMDLRPVLSLKTKIIQIKKIKAGESVGYNRTFVATQDCTIAVLPLGYYEGWPRILSNKGQVLVAGQYCQIVGNICMNLMMIKLADGLEARVGEEVVLIGSSGTSYLSADDQAQAAQTISYEIVTRLNNILPRYIISDI